MSTMLDASSSVDGASAEKSHRRRRRHRGAKPQEWAGPQQRAALLRRVPQSVRDHDRRAVLALLRQTATQRREAGLEPPAAAATAPSGGGRAVPQQELTLLQGACLVGDSNELVVLLLLNGASPDVATPTEGFTPLHLALVGGGSARDVIVKELLVYGADVNKKDTSGYSFLDITTQHKDYTALHPLIAKADKDPRAKRAREDNRAALESRRRAVQREAERRTDVEPVDPLEALPPELGLHILSFLRVSDLALACAVSSNWRCVATDHALWRQLYIKQVGAIPPRDELNLQELLKRQLRLDAQRKEHLQKQARASARLVVQAIVHQGCDHRSHGLQMPVNGRWGLMLLGSLNVRSGLSRVRSCWLDSDLNAHLVAVKVTRTVDNKYSVRCKNVSNMWTVFRLKPGDKISVLQHLPESNTCRVYFISLSLDCSQDHLIPATTVFYHNRA